MITAARYGRLFSCDPMLLLDRPDDDWPFIKALIQVAILDLEAAT